MKIECYGATLPQDDRQHMQNQDAFLILREPVMTAAVCDGAGNAEDAAGRIVCQLERLLTPATLGRLLSRNPWPRWIRILDSSLSDGSQCALAAASVVGDQARCVAVGDTRIYLLPADGGCELLTERSGKARLGSGEAVPLIATRTLAPHDVLLLVSDGAWTPLGPGGLEHAVRSAAVEHFSDVPQAILTAAARHGRADDMTAVVLRIVRLVER